MLLLNALGVNVQNPPVSVPTVFEPKEQGKLSKNTLSFLTLGVPSEYYEDSLVTAIKDMKNKNYTLYDIYQLLDKQPGSEKLDVDRMKKVQDIFYGKKPAKTDETKGNSLAETLEQLLHVFKDNLLIYQNDTYFWRETDSNIIKKIDYASLKPLFFKEMSKLGGMQLSREVIEMLNTFLLFASPHLNLKTLPPAFSTDSDELTFRYININEMINDTPCPTWDVFIENCGVNGPALMAYTWAIFFPVELRQYILIRSHGKTGKGVYTNWLQTIMGDEATCSLNPKNAHWPAACVGKRLGLFPELNNTSFVQSSEFKAITGNDTVSVTDKYEKAFSTKFDIRFVLSTNGSINIENRVSESSRCILVDMRPVSEYIEDYQEKLNNETPGFLFKCKQAFNELYNPKLKELKSDKSDFEAHAKIFEDDYEIVFERAFKIDEDAKLRSVTFTSAVNAVSKSDKYFKQNFKEWVLQNKPTVKVVKIRGHFHFKNLALSVELQNSPLVVHFK